MRAPEFWRSDGLLPAALAPLGTAYRLAGRLRAALVRPAEAGVPLVCVGNLVAGGAGKTPVALSLLSLLGRAGHAVHALCRGYRGREAGPLRVEPGRHGVFEVGDEALLLARAAPTWVARDRLAGARAAAAAGAGVVVMDDGLQYPGLVKHLSLLVVDGSYGFGNARVMPAGPLREPIGRGLARASAVVLLGADDWGVEARLGTRLPILRARLVPAEGAPELRDRRVVAFAGIGRPEKFFGTLEDLGAEVIERHAFADHHRYSPGQLAGLLANAEDADAGLVTTEKDAVRLPAGFRERVITLPVELEWQDPGALEVLLARLPGLEARRARSGAA